MEMTSSDALPVQGGGVHGPSMAEKRGTARLGYILCTSGSLVDRPVPTTPGKKKDLGLLP